MIKERVRKFIEKQPKYLTSISISQSILFILLNRFIQNTADAAFASLTSEFVPLICYTAGIYKMVEF